MIIVYFDNAATSLRSKELVDAYCEALSKELNPEELKKENSLLLTKFLGGVSKHYYLVPNATYAANEIALYLPKNLDVYLSNLEHSSNHAIWLSLYSSVKYFNYQDLLEIELPKEKSIFSISLITNLEGLELSLKEVEEKFRNTPHILILDISQYVQHKVPKFERADFFFFSAHKCFGPNGLGVIYARDGMDWNKENYDLDWCALYAWNRVLPNIINNLNSPNWTKKEKELNKYFVTNFPNNEYVELLNKDTKGCIFLILIKKVITAHDYVFYLAKKEILVRAGLSCSWLSAEKYDAKQIFRVSLNAQNTIEEIDYFFNAIRLFQLSDCI